MLYKKVKKISRRDWIPIDSVIDLDTIPNKVIVAELEKNKPIRISTHSLYKNHLGFKATKGNELTIKVRKSDGRLADRPDIPEIKLRLKKVVETQYNSTYVLGEIIDFRNSILTTKEYIKKRLIVEGWKILKEY